MSGKWPNLSGNKRWPLFYFIDWWPEYKMTSSLTRFICSYDRQDGRFKCQRMYPTGPVEGVTSMLKDPISNEITHALHRRSSHQHHQQQNDELNKHSIQQTDSEIEDEEPEEAGSLIVTEALPISEEGVWQRRARRSSFVSVCPQVKCNNESGDEPLRLENDCCLRCRRSSDFCGLARAQHLCHPEATCRSVFGSNETSTYQLGSPRDGAHSLSSLIECECPAGFSGNGASCHDIDECASPKLNECDPNTSECVNLTPGYECHCKPGFAPKQPTTPKSNYNKNTSISINQPDTTNNTNHLDNKRKSTQCVDIDECSELAFMEKCHRDAVCLNLHGSFKCECRDGFLGDGFSCHKWISPSVIIGARPQVASYFHRHQAATTKNNITNSGSNLVIDDLNAPESSEEDEQKHKEEDDQFRDLEGDEEDDNGTSDAKGLPKLSGSFWQPLRLELNPLLSQQVSFSF